MSTDATQSAIGEPQAPAFQTAVAPPVSEAPAELAPPLQSERLVSLDALRGFSMFWILGASAFERAFAELPVNRFTDVVGTQLQHVDWEGIHFEDLLFPTFMFVGGFSLVLALPKRIVRDGKAKTAWSIVRRALVLYLLGVWYYGGVAHGWDHVRWVGVLQRIAIGYLASALFYLYFKPRILIGILIGILVSYWALLTFVPTPGFGAGHFEEGHNLANYIDKMYLPGRKWDGDHDPEGLLSNFPAIGTTLLGVLAGIWMSKEGSKLRRAAFLLTAGVGLIVAGSAWGIEFPVIKKLWTSTYVLVAAGWSSIFLSIFYLSIDVLNLRKWALPFIWIGMNPITLYLLESLASAGTIAARFVGGDVEKAISASFGPGMGAVVTAIVATFVSLLIAKFLYDRKIFLRV